MDLVSLQPLFDPTAFVLVAGGTLLAVALRTPLGDLARAGGALRLLWRKPFSADPLLAQISAFGRIAARHGVVALERSVIEDKELAGVVATIVDGGDGVAVSETLATLRRARTERHLNAADTWASAADLAPGIGMIGTLLGLAGMFRAMDDPMAIGGAMAVALLSTLYGAVIANLVALPVANRLRQAARREAIERLRLDAPLIALAEREAPRMRRSNTAEAA